MDKLTSIRIKRDDGTYSNKIFISALSENIIWDNSHTLVDVLGNIDIQTGTVQEQIDKLFQEKINYKQLVDYVHKKIGDDISTWLENNLHAIQGSVLIDGTLTQSQQAADAAATGNQLRTLDSQVQTLAGDMQSAKDQLKTVSFSLDNYVDDGYVENGVAYFVHNGEVLFEITGIGGGGGGGGSSVNNATITVTNNTGWLSTTISSGSTCPISLNWTSIEDNLPTGDGTLQISVNGAIKSTQGIQQGNVNIDLGNYVSTGSNIVKVKISDIYGNARTINFNITVVALSISSTFDTTTAYDSAISFPYTPVGGNNLSKTVYFILDGHQIGTQQTTLSGRQLTYIIPKQSHGSHSLRVYLESEINGEIVTSNELYYEFIFIDESSQNTIIASSFNKTTANQYDAIAIPFRVYTPQSSTTAIAIYLNGNIVSQQTVDRTQHSYTFRASDAGTNVIRIVAANTYKEFTIEVEETDVQIQAVTDDLVLYLNPGNKTNNDNDRNVWSYNDITTQFNNFNWRIDGWQTDDNNINVLRLLGDSRVIIPYQPFAKDFKGTGKTIEIEFSTHDVADYTTTLISCFVDNIGLNITPQTVTVRGAQTELSTLYKENEHIRLSIVIEKQTLETRLILIYINGIMSRAVQYAAGERFSQSNPVNITIGSNDCGIDIYNIRIYDNDLSREQVLNNWIADTQVGADMIDRYAHNNVYDQSLNITAANLPSDLPYMVIEAEELPQYKGHKKTVSGSYTDPVYPAKSFTFEGCEIDVQGTSSSVYFRKNYDMKYKQGFKIGNTTASKYALRDGSIPFNRFVLKADVASSESTNNTGLTMFYNDTCPYKTPEMKENPKIRWGIEGVPIVLFWYNPTTNETQFMGKYNFNLPKRAPAPYGYGNDDTLESWEFERNNSANVKFQDNDFTTMAWDEVSGESYPEWYNDFEARFPSDEWRDYSKLNEFLSWVKSTYRQEATNETFTEPITFRLNSTTTLTNYSDDNSYAVVDETSGGQLTGYKLITFTKDTPAYRLTKFRAELGDYVEIESATYYYLFTEFFLMIDSRAKNMFIGFNGGPVEQENRAMDRKVTFQPYDMDTAIGTNNSGILMFGYFYEDGDTVSSIISGDDSSGSEALVFNAQDSVLWSNFRDGFRPELVTMYRSLRTNGSWSYDVVKTMYEDHQSKWPEAIFNEDAYIKYIYPVDHAVTEDESTHQLIKTTRYLTMLQGSKSEQRKWWLYNRFRYMDSKYNTGSAANNTLDVRLFNSGKLTITPAIDMYVACAFGLGSTPIMARTTTNTPVDFNYVVKSGATVQEMETSIYSGDLITDLGDLSIFYPNEINFAKGVRLKRLKIGDAASTYSNANLTTLDVSNSPLLESIDCRNCPNLASTINLENSPRLEEAYFEGTSITGINLADGCLIETLHLPSSVTTLVLENLNKLSDFQIGSYNNISTLMLTNIDDDIIDPLEILNQIPNGTQVHIEGLYWEAENSDEIDELFSLIENKNFKGVTRERINGIWIYHQDETPYIEGTIHTDSLTGAQVADYKSRYPLINVVADHVTSYLTFKTWDGSSTITTITYKDGNPTTALPAVPARENSSDGHYSYTAAGWNREQDAEVNDATAIENVRINNTVYAAYTRVVRTYTVTWKNADGTTLETDTNVPWGTRPTYNGSMPTYQGQTATGWDYDLSVGITGNTTITAKYIPQHTATFVLAAVDSPTGSQYTLVSSKFDEGSTPIYNGTTPTTAQGDTIEFTFTGWSPALAPIYKDTIYVAQFQDNRAVTIQYLARNISAYESNNNTTFASYSLAYATKLTSAKAPVTSVEPYAFSNDTALEVVDLSATSGIVTINANAFNGCYALTHVIIRSNTMATLSSTNAFTNTKIAMGNGAIYVPTGLIATYKANANWKNYFIIDINDYPLSDFSTIKDSWATIAAGTNYANYSVGDIKLIDVNGTQAYMQLVAKDTDILSSDHSSTAKMTWVTKDILTTHQMNATSTTSGGWGEAEMRTWLRETILPTLPKVVQNNIKTVDKTYRSKSPNDETLTIEDTIWIPSYKEVGFTNTTYVESDGVVYSGIFNSATNRIKYNSSGAADWWWLRSASSSAHFRNVNSSGGDYGNSASNTFGVVFGFCI